MLIGWNSNLFCDGESFPEQFTRIATVSGKIEMLVGCNYPPFIVVVKDSLITLQQSPRCVVKCNCWLAGIVTHFVWRRAEELS